MRAVELTRFGAAADVLRVVMDAECPVPGPREVLIEVRAASINPVDCAIRRGYGKDVFRSKGQVGAEPFPMRLGRDAAGVIAEVGSEVTGFTVGDRVYTAPTRATQADFIVAEAAEVAAMPRTLDFVAAASLPFVAMTTWNALVNQVGVTPERAPALRVVITRGAGGVGSFAIQLMKAWGAHVATTCSTRNVDFVRSLGADVIVDYTRSKVGAELRDYDVVLDGSFDLEADLLGTLKTGADAAYITITSPKIRLADEFGLEEGLRRADQLLSNRVAAQIKLGRRYYWGFMRPDGAALSRVSELVEQGAIRPYVDRVFPLSEIAAAHEYCESGVARGKIVMDLSENNANSRRS
jgi:NADPH:quinone reductase-like Zn-dependent oxidoreductase